MGKPKKNKSTIKKKQKYHFESARKTQNKDWGPIEDEENELYEELEKLGYRIAAMIGDGNCLFRALSDQLYQTPNHYSKIRQRTLDYIEKNETYFAEFIEDDENFAEYCKRLRKDGSWGGNQELYAAGQEYKVNIAIYQVHTPPLVLKCGIENAPTINIAYQGQQHYDSIHSLKRLYSDERDDEGDDEGDDPANDDNDPAIDTEEDPVNDANLTSIINPLKDDKREINLESDKEEKKKSKMKNVFPSGRCPCNSGKKYRKCCRKRDFNIKEKEELESKIRNLNLITRDTQYISI